MTYLYSRNDSALAAAVAVYALCIVHTSLGFIPHISPSGTGQGNQITTNRNVFGQAKGQERPHTFTPATTETSRPIQRGGHLQTTFDDESWKTPKRGFAASLFDFDTLRFRLARIRALGPGMDSRRRPPKNVHIILFNPGSDNEGVHTVEFPKGSGNNVLLAFESRKECRRFNKMLKAQEFFNPSPRTIKLASLEEYCEGLGVETQIVPKGTNLTPPKDAVDELDHNPELEDTRDLLDEIFMRSIYENEEHISEEGLLHDDLVEGISEEHDTNDRFEDVVRRDISEEEVEEARVSLEKLFQKSGEEAASNNLEKTRSSLEDLFARSGKDTHEIRAEGALDVEQEGRWD